jgi:hypothetical protein
VTSRLVSVAAALVLTGCYSYLPVSTAEPQVGARVAAGLTVDGADTLARAVGPGITTLRGDVVAAEDGTITLALTSVTDRTGQVTSWKGEEVRVPQGAVERLEQRKLALGRSVLFAAAFLGGSVAAWEAFQAGIRGGAIPNPGGGGEPK